MWQYALLMRVPVGPNAVFALVLAACLVVATAIAHGAQVLRSRVDAVRVDVTVTDRQGMFGAGLTRDDFQVLDNGRPQPLTGFSSGASPLTVAFILDMSDSMMPHVRRLGAAAEAFISALTPNDRAAVGSLMSPGPLRTDPDALRRDLSYLTLGEGSLVWQSIGTASKTVAAGDGRRAILIATDGDDTMDVVRRLAPEVSPSMRFSAPTWAALDQWFLTSKTADGALQNSAVQLYVVALQDSRVTSTLRKLADASGGRVIRVGRETKLPDLFAGVVEELRQQYVLSFAPPEQDGQLHELSVRVKRPGLSVRTRTTYVAGGK